ncbi:hypothetical protein BCR34DRAFT_647008 [Clohesyomyces aquaticus]|uniref:Uncharacterized protein n=1 Tax=Clohesyomyces aquaticus TaxID=1231657 RepID=A0A1Y1ZVC1_9PLEO|nr:hypothetical protein BCR34DRAFT_647008 [Clohesyomyces aquaticus]
MSPIHSPLLLLRRQPHWVFLSLALFPPHVILNRRPRLSTASLRRPSSRSSSSTRTQPICHLRDPQSIMDLFINPSTHLQFCLSMLFHPRLVNPNNNTSILARNNQSVLAPYPSPLTRKESFIFILTPTPPHNPRYKPIPELWPIPTPTPTSASTTPCFPPFLLPSHTTIITSVISFTPHSTNLNRNRRTPTTTTSSTTPPRSRQTPRFDASNLVSDEDDYGEDNEKPEQGPTAAETEEGGPGTRGKWAGLDEGVFCSLEGGGRWVDGHVGGGELEGWVGSVRMENWDILGSFGRKEEG